MDLSMEPSRDLPSVSTGMELPAGDIPPEIFPIHASHVSREAARLEYVSARLVSHTHTMDQRIKDICDGFMQIARQLQGSSPVSFSAERQVADDSSAMVEPLPSAPNPLAEALMRLVVHFQFHDALVQGLCQLISDLHEVEHSLLFMIGQASKQKPQPSILRQIHARQATADSQWREVETQNHDDIVLF